MITSWVPPNSDYPPPAPNEPPLHRAARLGDHEAIRGLVASGSDIDGLFDVALDPGAFREPVTPLAQAAGSAEGATAATLRLLLDLGASVNAGPSGRPALWYACGGMGWNHPPGGDADRLSTLLAAGENATWTRPSRGGGPGQSLLARAAASGDPDRLSLLLGAGADPDPAGIAEAHEWPLHEAVRSGSVPAVRVLLDSGADTNRPLAGYGEPLLGMSDSVEMVDLLLRHGADLDPPREVPGNRSSPAERRALTLFELATSESAGPEVRRAILRLVIDRLEVAPDVMAGALRHAVFAHEPDAVDALLIVGADPFLVPHLLKHACFGARNGADPTIERVIDALVDAGLDPNDEDAQGFRPLLTALSPDTFGADYQESDGFNAPAALALLRQGARPDIVYPETTVMTMDGHTMSGLTTLHAAALAGAGTVVEALIAAGVDTTLSTPDARSALDLARATLSEVTGASAWRPEPAAADAAAWERRRAAEEQASHELVLTQAHRCVYLLEHLAMPGTT